MTFGSQIIATVPTVQVVTISANVQLIKEVLKLLLGRRAASNIHVRGTDGSFDPAQSAGDSWQPMLETFYFLPCSVPDRSHTAPRSRQLQYLSHASPRVRQLQYLSHAAPRVRQLQDLSHISVFENVCLNNQAAVAMAKMSHKGVLPQAWVPHLGSGKNAMLCSCYAALASPSSDDGSAEVVPSGTLAPISTATPDAATATVTIAPRADASTPTITSQWWVGGQTVLIDDSR
jgi:hypothetical protein